MPRRIDTRPKTYEVPLTEGVEDFRVRIETFSRDDQYGRYGIGILTDTLGIVRIAGGVFTPLDFDNEFNIFGFLDGVCTSGRRRVDSEHDATKMRKSSLNISASELRTWQARETQVAEGELTAAHLGTHQKLHIGLDQHGIQQCLLDQHAQTEEIMTVGAMNKVFDRIPIIIEESDLPAWTEIMQSVA